MCPHHYERSEAEWQTQEEQRKNSAGDGANGFSMGRERFETGEAPVLRVWRKNVGRAPRPASFVLRDLQGDKKQTPTTLSHFFEAFGDFE